MSGKVLQLSPRASTRFTRNRTAAQDSRSAPSATSLDMGFLPSWFEPESDQVSRRTNWGAISGLALSVVISGSVWAGVVWMVSRFWK